ncbi:hypothetical protein ACFL08_01350 [Patescibacteria group bacterium]
MKTNAFNVACVEKIIADSIGAINNHYSSVVPSDVYEKFRYFLNIVTEEIIDQLQYEEKMEGEVALLLIKGDFSKFIGNFLLREEVADTCNELSEWLSKGWR